MGRIILASVAAILPCLPAFADDAPSFDIQRFCQQVSQAEGRSDDLVEKRCQDQEFVARDSMRGRVVETHIMAYCKEVADVVGGSYFFLLGCIDQKEEERQRKVPGG